MARLGQRRKKRKQALTFFIHSVFPMTSSLSRTRRFALAPDASNHSFPASLMSKDRAGLAIASAACAAALAAFSTSLMAAPELITDEQTVDASDQGILSEEILVTGSGAKLTLLNSAYISSSKVTVADGGVLAFQGTVFGPTEDGLPLFETLTLSGGSLQASAGPTDGDVFAADVKNLAVAKTSTIELRGLGCTDGSNASSILAVQNFDVASDAKLRLTVKDGGLFAYGMSSLEASQRSGNGSGNAFFPGNSSGHSRDCSEGALEGALVIAKDFELSPNVFITLGNADGKEGSANLLLGDGARLILAASTEAASEGRDAAIPVFSAHSDASIVFEEGSAVWVPDLSSSSDLSFLDIEDADLKGLEHLHIYGNGMEWTLEDGLNAVEYSGEFGAVLSALRDNLDDPMMPSFFRTVISSSLKPETAQNMLSEMARFTSAIGTDRRMSILYAQSASWLTDFWRDGDFAELPLSASRRHEPSSGAQGWTTPTLPIFISASSSNVEDESDLSGLGTYEMDVDETLLRVGTAVGKGAWRFGANFALSSAEVEPSSAGVRPFRGEADTMLFTLWGGRPIAGGRAGVVAADVTYMSADERAEVPMMGSWIESRDVKRSLVAGGVSWLLPPARWAGISWEGSLGARVLHYLKTDYAIEDGSVDLMDVREDAKTLGLLSAAWTARWSADLPALPKTGAFDFWWDFSPKRASFKAQAGADVFFGGEKRRASYRAYGAQAPAAAIEHEVFDQTRFHASVGGVLDFAESRLGVELFASKTDGGYVAKGAALKLDWVLG